jgi:hypothetical protein
MSNRRRDGSVSLRARVLLQNPWGRPPGGAGLPPTAAAPSSPSGQGARPLTSRPGLRGRAAEKKCAPEGLPSTIGRGRYIDTPPHDALEVVLHRRGDPSAARKRHARSRRIAPLDSGSHINAAVSGHRASNVSPRTAGPRGSTPDRRGWGTQPPARSHSVLFAVSLSGSWPTAYPVCPDAAPRV